MDPKQEFLTLLRDYDYLKEALLEKAWELTPDDIKELIMTDVELTPDNIKRTKKWLIEPKRRFANKCAIELIIDNKADEVKEYINFLQADIYD